MPPDWLSPSDWKFCQDHLPIACVDVLPVQFDDGVLARIGLIRRDTPHQGRRWCLVGGRLRRDESLADGAARQIAETLGPSVTFPAGAVAKPATITEYFTTPRPIGRHDPRQHAVAIVFVVPITGTVRPSGEAVDFRWFDVAHLPPPEQWGFGQDAVAADCLSTYTKCSTVRPLK